jgi:cell shape-determining protein MreC
MKASEFVNPDIKVESEHLTQLNEQKEELLSKVQTLKGELLEWRNKLDGQVKSFRGVRAIPPLLYVEVNNESIILRLLLAVFH